MIYLQIIIVALAFTVLVAQIHHFLRLRVPGNEAAFLPLSASFFALLLCERYLHDGGDVLLISLVAIVQAQSAFAVWWVARRRTRAAARSVAATGQAAAMD